MLVWYFYIFLGLIVQLVEYNFWSFQFCSGFMLSWVINYRFIAAITDSKQLLDLTRIFDSHRKTNSKFWWIDCSQESLLSMGKNVGKLQGKQMYLWEWSLASGMFAELTIKFYLNYWRIFNKNNSLAEEWTQELDCIGLVEHEEHWFWFKYNWINLNNLWTTLSLDILQISPQIYLDSCKILFSRLTRISSNFRPALSLNYGREIFLEPSFVVAKTNKQTHITVTLSLSKPKQ